VGIELRRPIGLAVLTGGALLVVAGCGPGLLLSADSPDQAVTTALEQAQTTPLVMSFSGSLGLQTSGLGNLPGQIQSALGQLGGGGSATGKLTQESSARRELDVTAAGQSLSFVEYDGHAYVQSDGGGYAELPASSRATPVVSASDISTAVGDLGFSDAGAATKDGQSVEDYHADLTSAVLGKLVQDLAGSASGSSGSGLQQEMSLLAGLATTSGSVDLWVSTANGGLVAASLTGKISVDFGAIASAFAGLASGAGGAASLPTGSASVSLSLNAQVSDYDGAVKVTQPVATTTLPAGTAQGWWESGTGIA
jgi:hypothetical protein